MKTTLAWLRSWWAAPSSPPDEGAHPDPEPGALVWRLHPREFFTAGVDTNEVGEALLAMSWPASDAEGESKEQTSPAAFGVSGPYDGVIQIFSPLSEQALEVGVEHLDLLIAILSSLDRSPKSRES